MRYQLAWVGFDRGVWLLFTDRPEESIREWDHEAVVLAQLRDEGWEISGPYPEGRRKGFRDMD